MIDHNEAFVVTALSMFSDDVWYVDFGAFMHLFHKRFFFYEYEKHHQLKYIWEIIKHERL